MEFLVRIHPELKRLFFKCRFIIIILINRQAAQGSAEANDSRRTCPMVQLIVGKKGKGKTKCLLDKVNTEVKNILGNVVYLDKDTAHMYELNNKIRLIAVPAFGISTTEEFIGFVLGIISQDHDLEQMYFDSFLIISDLKGKDIVPAIRRIKEISEKYGVDFVLSVSMDESEIPEEIKPLIAISL